MFVGKGSGCAASEPDRGPQPRGAAQGGDGRAPLSDRNPHC